MNMATRAQVMRMRGASGEVSLEPATWQAALFDARSIDWTPDRRLDEDTWTLDEAASAYLGGAFVALGRPDLAPAARLLMSGETHGRVEDA